jgi:hypothetical protein
MLRTYSFPLIILCASIHCADNTTTNSITKEPFKLERKTYWSQFVDSVSPFMKKIGFEVNPEEGQHESWSAGLIAEPLATISNLPFFAAAYTHRQSAPLSAMALATAGTASALSHAIPYKILLRLDQLAASFSVLSVAYDAQLYKWDNFLRTIKNPVVSGLAVLAGLTFGTDVFIRRSAVIERKKIHEYTHPLWHVLAAGLAHATLSANKK